MARIDNVSTNDMSIKHLDTTKDIVITPMKELGGPVQLNTAHTWTAKVSDWANYIGDYPVTIESNNIVVNSSEFTSLPAGIYHLEVWEEWIDSNNEKQRSIYPSPQSTIDFNIYRNITDLAEKEIKSIGFQDVVDQAVMNIGMNYVFKVNMIESDQTATVVQSAADGKNYVTFNIPQGDTDALNVARNSSWIYNNIKPLSAHRGAHIDAPENTAMAVAHAGMYGYGLIECDPRLTSDNQVVVMHDDTVDRMTDGTGNVSDFTLDQLKQMTVDATFSGKNDYNTIRVPTLAEILHEVNQYGMGVNIDGSKLNWQDDNVINTVIGVIKKAGLMGRSFFVISDSAARKRLNALYPEAALTWLDYDNINNYIAEAKTYTNAVISIGYGNLSRDYSAIAASGLPLQVYGVNSASQYEDCVQHGARFIETDSLLPMTVTPS